MNKAFYKGKTRKEQGLQINIKEVFKEFDRLNPGFADEAIAVYKRLNASQLLRRLKP